MREANAKTPIMDRAWKDGDSILVGIWKQLLYTDFPCAALGFLHDLMRDLDVIDNVNQEKRSAPFVQIHESAMVILGDNDGQKLKEWRRLYRDNRDAFQGLASDWYDHCRSVDLFDLFS